MSQANQGAETHGFLGEEFLTWLWFKWETEGGEFTLSGGRVVGIAIDDFLTFGALTEDETEQTLRRGLPTRATWSPMPVRARWSTQSPLMWRLRPAGHCRRPPTLFHGGRLWRVSVN